MLQRTFNAGLISAAPISASYAKRMWDRALRMVVFDTLDLIYDLTQTFQDELTDRAGRTSSRSRRWVPK